MSTATTPGNEYSVEGAKLLMALELGQKWWKVAFGKGFGDGARIRTIRAGNTKALMLEVAKAKRELGLPQQAAVESCYEAGREGFWLHRFLLSEGVVNHVIDSASIEKSRRKRQAKTDRLDAVGLLNLLVRHALGDKRALRVINVPSVEDEDARRLHRELETLKKERTRSSNRILGLLMLHGVRLAGVRGDFAERVAKIRLWDGSRLPPGIEGQILREHQRMQVVQEQIGELEAFRREAIRTAESEVLKKVADLQRIKAIGDNGSWTLVMEFFGWRQFRNVKEIGALSGLAPTPYQSGEGNREQGISKAGNRHVRRMMIQLAWGWLRWQPDSELTKWFLRRFARGGKRARKVGIVALARKLLIALWKYVELGEVPEGAVLKA